MNLNKIKRIKRKKAALEMSVGTIVTIVLAVTFLTLGLVLIRGIFSASINVVELTEGQLNNEISKLFTEDKKLVVLPDSKIIEIKQEDVGAVGVGIKNLIEGTSETSKFSYEVQVADPDIRRKCSINEQQALEYIKVGRAVDNQAIAPGDFIAYKVRFEIPTTAPLCIIRYGVTVKEGTSVYASDFFDVDINAK
jgi:hypothetical protein